MTLAERLASILPRRRTDVRGWCAIDVAHERLCGVAVERPSAPGGKARVIRHVQLSAAAEDDESLKKAVREISVNRFGWTLPLPRSQYRLFVIQEPAVAPAEMAQSVRWAIGPLIEDGLTDVTVDQMSIPTEKHMPERQRHIYAVAARRDAVQQRMQQFRDAGATLGVVDIRETAQRNLATAIEEPDRGLGLLGLGPLGVQLTFSLNGELYLDRFVEARTETLADDDADSRERTLNLIALQVQRSIDFMYRTMPFAKPTRIVVAPGLAQAMVAEHLSQNVAEPVEAPDLTAFVDISATPQLEDRAFAAAALPAIGAALRVERDR